MVRDFIMDRVLVLVWLMLICASAIISFSIQRRDDHTP